MISVKFFSKVSNKSNKQKINKDFKASDSKEEKKESG